MKEYLLEQYSASRDAPYNFGFQATQKRMCDLGWRIHTIDMSEWCNYINVLWERET